eukprot:CAMPEP_0174898376 /NCGR_PEP_ID=MMETSP0167-20121228/21310_1 /TAXON_ID=38298 /ORGANISM="Rhodella maculata, Strain CCMP736" /LENGTH=199 /DNA_ID=CAMNT_0016138937 /DNA_START=36 /DNA_END=631 /DNA_ORIENTATION=+
MSGKTANKSYLLEFHGVECDHCVEMQPLIKRVEEELKIPVRQFEVWYNEDNLRLLQTLDKFNACGGVPYYFNKRTRGWICGATDWDNFKAWAEGRAHQRMKPPELSRDGADAGAPAAAPVGAGSSGIGGGAQPTPSGPFAIFGQALVWFENMQKEGMNRMQTRTDRAGRKDEEGGEGGGAAAPPEAGGKVGLAGRGAFV